MSFERCAFLLAVGLFLLSVVGFPARAFAEPRNLFGAHAKINLGATDNAFASPNNEKTDLFMTYQAGISVGRRLAAGTVDLDLGVSGYISTISGTLTQLFGDSGAKLVFPITNRIQMQVSDRFIPSPLEFSDIEEARTNQTQANHASAVFLYDVPLAGAWSGELSTSLVRIDIIDIDDRFAGDRPDRFLFGAETSLTRHLGRRSNLTLSGNFHRTLFDREAVLLQDFSQMGSILNWTYRPRRQFQISVDGGIGVFFADGESQLTGIGATALAWIPTSRSKLVVEGRRVQGTQLDGRSYETTSAAFDASHQLTRQLTLQAGVLYVLLSGTGVGTVSIPGGSESQLFSAKTAARLSLGRNLVLGLSFRHSRNFGEFTADDFKRNTGLLSLEASY